MTKAIGLCQRALRAPRAVCALVLVLLAGNAFADASPTPESLVYRTVEGQSLRAFVFAPAKVEKTGARSAAIVVVHPGGFEEGSAQFNFKDAQRFASLGMVAIAIDYRLSNEHVTPVDALADTCAAFAWVRKHAKTLHVDPHRVAGYGESAGGQLVAAAATIDCPKSSGEKAQVRPDLMVLVSPMVDTAIDRYAGLLHGRARAIDYSPLTHLDVSTAPTLLVQGELDNTTPVDAAKRFCARLQALHATCELALYPKVGHLLTRNLKDQEGEIDPDPVDLANALARERIFLAAHGYITQSEPNQAMHQ